MIVWSLYGLNLGGGIDSEGSSVPKVIQPNCSRDPLGHLSK